MSSVHSGSLTHVQEVRNPIGFQDNVDSDLPLETGIQQVFKDVYICEQVHNHCNNLA